MRLAATSCKSCQAAKYFVATSTMRSRRRRQLEATGGNFTNEHHPGEARGCRSQSPQKVGSPCPCHHSCAWGTLCLGRLWRERADMLHMREAAAKVLVLVILLWIYGNTSSAIKMTHARACRQQRGAPEGGGRGAAHADSRLQLHMFTRIDWQHEHSDSFFLSSLPSLTCHPWQLWPN